MKNLIIFALKKNDFPMFIKLWNIQSLYDKKYETELWTDDEGNTLAHYACLHHDNKLWDFAKTKPINLTHLNKAGKAAIHVFVESSFVQNITHKPKSIKERLVLYWIEFLNRIKFFSPYLKEYISTKKDDESIPISISFNEQILKDLIANGADINQFREYPEKKELGWTSTDYGSYSRKDNMGTPLELLVYFFWEFILFPAFRSKNEQVIEEYYNFFQFLTSLGANPNLIVQGNAKDNHITDAMESYPSRIVSSFYIKFITNELDYIVFKPFLIDSHIDFMVSDDLGNTVLHTLFARLSARKAKFSDKVCENIITDIANNKQLTVEALELKNDFNMSPIELIRGDAEHLRKFLSSFALSQKLDKILEVKTEVKERRGARKI